MKRTLLALGAVLASASAAGAYTHGTHGGGIERRAYNQETRIQKGLREGSLTPSEYRQLEAEQARIRALTAQAWRDGVLTPHERYELRRAQQEASRHIRYERHDAEARWQHRRPWHPYPPYWRRWWW